MNILGAGPFAEYSGFTLDDSFVDRPVSPDSNILPVNCARDLSSTFWPWEFFSAETATQEPPTPPTSNIEYAEGLPDLQVSGAEISNCSALFAYQAAEDFDIDISYALEAESDFSFPDEVILTFFVIAGTDTLFEDEEIGTGSASLSGSTTVTLPASDVPNRVFIRARAVAGSGSIQTSSAEFVVT